MFCSFENVLKYLSMAGFADFESRQITLLNKERQIIEEGCEKGDFVVVKASKGVHVRGVE